MTKYRVEIHPFPTIVEVSTDNEDCLGFDSPQEAKDHALKTSLMNMKHYTRELDAQFKLHRKLLDMEMEGDFFA